MESANKIKVTLKAARVNKGYTQKNAAIRLGVSPETLSNWENGRTQPDAEAIQALEALYGIPYDWLYFLPKLTVKP